MSHLATHLIFILFALSLVNCKHANTVTAPLSSFDSTDYVEADFCCDYDEQVVTMENYKSLLDSIGAALDTLCTPSTCVAPMAQMNAVLLKVDSITMPEGFMDRKREYNDYFSEVLDSLSKTEADDSWNYDKAEILVNDRLQAVIKNRLCKH